MASRSLKNALGKQISVNGSMKLASGLQISSCYRNYAQGQGLSADEAYGSIPPPEKNDGYVPDINHYVDDSLHSKLSNRRYAFYLLIFSLSKCFAKF